MPDQRSARLQDAGELLDNASVVGRMRKESEGGEEIEHGVEPLAPPRRQLPHIAARVTKIPARPALPGDVEQISGVVEPVDVVSGLREQMRVPALPTRHIQHSRADWQLEELDDTGYFLSIPLGREKQAVLPEIVGVE
jgi:hypothetical protein